MKSSSSLLGLIALSFLTLTTPFVSARHPRRVVNHLRQLESRSNAELSSRAADITGLKERAVATTAKQSNRKRCKKGNTPKLTNAVTTNSTTVVAVKSNTTPSKPKPKAQATTSGCFPALGFNMPSDTPDSLDGWWCDPSTEYAFVGFSYEVTACQSKSDLTSHFKDIRSRFKGRYIRMYGACDRNGFYDDVIDAAWESGLGIHALVWFGFDGGNIWQTRRDSLFNTLQSNPRAKYVTRTVQFGSEPLFDGVLSVDALASQVNSAKSKLKNLGISVTVSDMAWSFQKEGGGKAVLNAMDSVHAHILPYFAGDARGGGDSWHNVNNDINWFLDNTDNKKIYLSENGWPSQSSQGVQPNSRTATTDISNEQKFYDLLDSQCAWFKKTGPKGGVAWFAHIYADDQEPGYGILRTSGPNGQKKFPFNPKTHC